MEEASKRGIQLLIVVPSVTIGRMLQPTLNLTLSAVATYMKGTKKAYSNAVGAYVDVQESGCCPCPYFGV
jgi:cinnamoyl-CoA reductase